MYACNIIFHAALLSNIKADREVRKGEGQRETRERENERERERTKKG